MKHLKLVRVKSDKRSHWIAKAPLGASVEWDAEIIKEQENHLIAWSSVKGVKFSNRGAVRFQKAVDGQGTEVKVVIEYNLPSDAIAAAVAKFLCQDPEQELGNALHRFKRLMEAGEIAKPKVNLFAGDNSELLFVEHSAKV